MFKNSFVCVEKELEDFHNDSKVNTSRIKLLLKFPKLSLNILNLGSIKITNEEVKPRKNIKIYQKDNKKGGLF
jgi:hypothetical protein